MTDTANSTNVPIQVEGFGEQTIRRSFLIKVLSLLTCTLLITTTIVAVATVSPDIQDFLIENWWIAAMAMIGLLSVAVALACSMQLRQSYPLNYFMLTALTVTQALLLAYIVSAYRTPSIVIAVSMTCMGTGLTALLAMATQIDMTRFGMHLIVALLVLVGSELLLFAFMPSLRIQDRLIGGMASLMFSLYVAVDIQLLLGGKQFILYPEDYIGAVITLHLDIVNVFTTLYRLISEYKDRTRETDSTLKDGTRPT